MDTLTVKLPRSLKRKFSERARKSGRTQSDLAREWIERILAEKEQLSCHDLMQGACGHYTGPKDSSRREGFGD